MNNMANSNIFYINKNDALFIKLTDKLTALNAISFKRLVENNFLNEDKATKLYLDMSETEYLDSTFMGIIIYVHKKLNKKDNKKILKIVNASKNAKENLKSLGIDKLIIFESNAEKLDKNKIKKFHCFDEKENKILRSTIINSHILLSKINENNKIKFKSLINRIKKEKNN